MNDSSDGKTLRLIFHIFIENTFFLDSTAQIHQHRSSNRIAYVVRIVVCVKKIGVQTHFDCVQIWIFDLWKLTRIYFEFCKFFAKLSGHMFLRQAWYNEHDGLSGLSFDNQIIIPMVRYSCSSYEALT